MKFYMKSKNETQWNEITEYVHLPSVRMFFTVDGTFNAVNFTLRTPKSLFGLDLTKPIPPKYQIKVSEVDNGSLENENNTWHFITTNINNAIVRKEVTGDDNEVLVNSLYIQEVNANDIISKLDNRYLPNYTVTQPKTRFFNTFVKGGGAEFRVQDRFSQDGSPIVLPQGSKRNLASTNLNGEMLFGYDSLEGKHYIEFNEIDEVALSVDVELALAKTASSWGTGKLLGINRKYNFSKRVREDVLGIETWDLTPPSKLIIEKKYYDNGLVINSETEIQTFIYSGGEVEVSTDFLGSATIKSLSNLNYSSFSTTINKNENYDKVRIYFKLEMSEAHNTYFLQSYGYAPTDIPGYNNDSYVKTYIDNLIIRGRTGSYDTEIDEKYITLLEFINKAIFDYNLNSNDKVKLANDVIPLLSVPMKESEWNDYTLRELLERAFKYVGILPVLRPNNEITYVKTQKVARYIDLEQVGGKEGEHLTDDYYDKVVSSAKNLVSDKDFITEVIPLSSTETEFSRIRDTNAGYITSHDIYFVSNGILHTPGLSFNINSQTINTNMDKPYHWDITERLFEEDIYNSFPNVRLDWQVDSEDESPRALSSLLTKANTIYYTSGSNVISGLFNQGEYVQNFDFWGSIGNLFSPGYVAEYAITELLIVLAYSQVGNPFGANMSQPDINLSDMKNWELHLTYVPIFDEITTKYLSNMENRKNLDWEKKLNLRDRVISYDNNEEILRNEMERKGNVKELFIEKYEKLSDSIPVNAIVNDNLYVTSKQVSIYHNLVEVEYVLQKNFILQNEDIRLPVEFERYNVPYEYVRRELQIENHIIFMREYDQKYYYSRLGSTKQFFEEVFFNENYPLDGTLYAKMNIDERLYLMRVGKLDTRFTMILSGKFLDNYTAGLQRYVGANENELYSIPLSYTDGQGKFNLLKDLEIGYNNSIEPLRLKRLGNEPYDVKQFPVGDYDDLEVDLNVKLIDLKDDLMMMKDAREQVSITHTSYLQNETQEIKFYRFMPITNLGFMIRDVELSDDLKLFGIDYEDFNFSYSFEIEEISEGNSYRVKVISDDVDYFELGIVFINEFDGQYTLVGALKNPIINGNVLEFYVTSTMTGLKPNPRINIEALFDISSELELGTSHYVELISGDIGFISEFYDHRSHKVDSTFDVLGDLELGTSYHYDELLGDINFEMDYQHYPSKRVDSTFDVFGDLEIGLSNNFELLGDVGFNAIYEYHPSKNVDSTLLVSGDLELGTSSHVELLGNVNFEMDYQHYPSKRVDSTFDVLGDLELGTSYHYDELLGDINFEMDYQYYPSKLENIYAGLLVTSELELGTSSYAELVGNVNFEMNGEANPLVNIYVGVDSTFDVFGDLELGTSSYAELLGDIEFIVDATIDNSTQSQLSTPNIGATASCQTSGTVSNPTYTFSIEVTNIASVQVRMYVSIGGVWQNRLMNGNSTDTFTRSKSSPWGVEEVRAYATATGYEDSETRTGSRSVSCPTPDPDPQPGLTWQYNGPSSSQVCLPAGYNPIGTSCTVSGQTIVVSGDDIGRPLGCYELICKI